MRIEKSRFWAMSGYNSRTEIVLLGKDLNRVSMSRSAHKSHSTRNSAVKTLLLDGSACSRCSASDAHYFHYTAVDNSAEIPIFFDPLNRKAHHGHTGLHDFFDFLFTF